MTVIFDKCPGHEKAPDQDHENRYLDQEKMPLGLLKMSPSVYFKDLAKSIKAPLDQKPNHELDQKASPRHHQKVKKPNFYSSHPLFRL